MSGSISEAMTTAVKTTKTKSNIRYKRKATNKITRAFMTVPALMGIGSVLGMDPVHLGVMVVFNVIIGFVTPPVGLCLFIVTSLAKTTIDKVTIHLLPMVAIAVAILMVITFSPGLVLYLPNLLVK